MNSGNKYLKNLIITAALAALAAGMSAWAGAKEVGLCILFWYSIIVSLLASIIAFRDLSDFSQFYLKTTRDLTMWSWYNRLALLGVSLVFLGFAWVLRSVTPDLASIWVLVGVSVVCAFLLFSGYVNPWIMMRARQDSGRIVSIAEARAHVKPDESVIVIDVNGHVRAHPDHQVVRPHVAGGKPIGGEDVVLTYCGLTNLGVAVSPQLDGQRMELRPITQLHNNLVLADRVSGEPIQQLWMQTESDRNSGTGRALREWPTFRMPFSKYEEAYPDGEVFLNDYRTKDTRQSFFRNPFLAVYDLVFDFAFDNTIKGQETEDEPFFPTVEYNDQRLAAKEKVWAFNVGDDYVAYSEDFVREQGEPINIKVGGQDIVVAYDEDHQSMGIFKNTTGAPVKAVDHYGVSAEGTLPRVETVKAGAYWIVWSHFYPNTDVNRV